MANRSEITIVGGGVVGLSVAMGLLQAGRRVCVLDGADNDARAERLFADIIDQGARLPSQRRFAARERNLHRGYVEIHAALHDDLLALLP